MEMTKWKFKGGFNRWVKCKGPTSLKEKCVTNTTMSTDLGVELSSFGSFEVNASKRKRSKEQLSPIFCKRSKANIASPSSSVGLKDSGIGHSFSLSLFLTEINAEASPSSPK